MPSIVSPNIPHWDPSFLDTLYTVSVGQILRIYRFDAKCMFYDDDNEIFLIFDLAVSQTVMAFTEPLISDIRE